MNDKKFSEFGNSNNDKTGRKCFKCKGPLSFHDLSLSNPQLEQEELKRLWESDTLEFFCCNCFNLRLINNPDPRSAMEILRGYILVGNIRPFIDLIYFKSELLTLVLRDIFPSLEIGSALNLFDSLLHEFNLLIEPKQHSRMSFNLLLLLTSIKHLQLKSRLKEEAIKILQEGNPFKIAYLIEYYGHAELYFDKSSELGYEKVAYTFDLFTDEELKELLCSKDLILRNNLVKTIQILNGEIEPEDNHEGRLFYTVITKDHWPMLKRLALLGLSDMWETLDISETEYYDF